MANRFKFAQDQDGQSAAMSSQAQLDKFVQLIQPKRGNPNRAKTVKEFWSAVAERKLRLETNTFETLLLGRPATGGAGHIGILTLCGAGHRSVFSLSDRLTQSNKNALQFLFWLVSPRPDPRGKHPVHQDAPGMKEFIKSLPAAEFTQMKLHRHIMCQDPYHSEIACAFVDTLRSFADDLTPGKNGGQFRHLDLYVDGQAAIDRYYAWVKAGASLAGGVDSQMISMHENDASFHGDVRTTSADQQLSRPVSSEPTCWADIVLEDPEQQSLLEEEAARSSALHHAEKNQKRIQEMQAKDPLGLHDHRLEAASFRRKRKKLTSQPEDAHPRHLEARRGIAGVLQSQLNRQMQSGKPAARIPRSESADSIPSDDDQLIESDRNKSAASTIPQPVLDGSVSTADVDFNPAGFLWEVHSLTSFDELQQGLKRLQRRTGGHNELIKELVKDHFDQFVFCKTTINRISQLLGIGSGSGTFSAPQPPKASPDGTIPASKQQRRPSVLAKVPFTAGSTPNQYTVKYGQSMPSAQAQRLEVMLTTISHLADRVFSPVLAKQAELNRMKRVLGVLGRHRHVFTLPGSMQRAAQARDLDQVVQLYRQLRVLSGSDPLSQKILKSAHLVVQRVREDLLQNLDDPSVPWEAQQKQIDYLIELDCRDPDPAWYYLRKRKEWVCRLIITEESRLRSNLQALLQDWFGYTPFDQPQPQNPDITEVDEPKLDKESPFLWGDWIQELQQFHVDRQISDPQIPTDTMIRSARRLWYHSLDCFVRRLTVILEGTMPEFHALVVKIQQQQDKPIPQAVSTPLVKKRRGSRRLSSSVLVPSEPNSQPAPSPREPPRARPKSSALLLVDEILSLAESLLRPIFFPPASPLRQSNQSPVQISEVFDWLQSTLPSIYTQDPSSCPEILTENEAPNPPGDSQPGVDDVAGELSSAEASPNLIANLKSQSSAEHRDPVPLVERGAGLSQFSIRRLVLCERILKGNLGEIRALSRLVHDALTWFSALRIKKSLVWVSQMLGPDLPLMAPGLIGFRKELFPMLEPSLDSPKGTLVTSLPLQLRHILFGAIHDVEFAAAVTNEYPCPVELTSGISQCIITYSDLMHRVSSQLEQQHSWETQNRSNRDLLTFHDTHRKLLFLLNDAVYTNETVCAEIFTELAPHTNSPGLLNEMANRISLLLDTVHDRVFGTVLRTFVIDLSESMRQSLLSKGIDWHCSQPPVHVHGWVQKLLLYLASMFQQMESIHCDEKESLMEGIILRLLVTWQSCVLEDIRPTLSKAGAARMRVDLGYFRVGVDRFVTEQTDKVFRAIDSQLFHEDFADLVRELVSSQKATTKILFSGLMYLPAS